MNVPFMKIYLGLSATAGLATYGTIVTNGYRERNYFRMIATAPAVSVFMMGAWPLYLFLGVMADLDTANKIDWDEWDD